MIDHAQKYNHYYNAYKQPLRIHNQHKKRCSKNNTPNHDLLPPTAINAASFISAFNIVFRTDSTGDPITILFVNIGPNLNWTFNLSNGTYTVPNTGTYLINYSYDLICISNGIIFFSVTRDNITIAASDISTIFETDKTIPIAQTFLTTLIAGDVMRFQFSSNGLASINGAMSIVQIS